jgi:hypothetical protein
VRHEERAGHVLGQTLLENLAKHIGAEMSITSVNKEMHRVIGEVLDVGADLVLAVSPGRAECGLALCQPQPEQPQP